MMHRVHRDRESCAHTRDSSAYRQTSSNMSIISTSDETMCSHEDADERHWLDDVINDDHCDYYNQVNHHRSKQQHDNASTYALTIIAMMKRRHHHNNETTHRATTSLSSAFDIKHPNSHTHTRTHMLHHESTLSNSVNRSSLSTLTNSEHGTRHSYHSPHDLTHKYQHTDARPHAH